MPFASSNPSIVLKYFKVHRGQRAFVVLLTFERRISRFPKPTGYCSTDDGAKEPHHNSAASFRADILPSLRLLLTLSRFSSYLSVSIALAWTCYANSERMSDDGGAKRRETDLAGTRVTTDAEYRTCIYISYGCVCIVYKICFFKFSHL